MIQADFRHILIAFILSGSFWGCQSAAQPAETAFFELIENSSSDGPVKPNVIKLQKRVEEAAAFCQRNRLNSEVAIFVDLGMHSGKYRCFVVRQSDAAIRVKGLVTHGSGKTGLSAGAREFSNVPNSYLSSLGKYKTGKAYSGDFGLAYKLYGLDETNNNAFKRYIVLHAHSCVPDEEMDDLLCQSWGCPTVSSEFLKTLQKVIDNSPLPVLLWVYDGR